MTTEYSMSDVLPKDSGGAKLLAWIDDATSQLDFGLPRGVGSESLGAASKTVANLGVGTHTAGSALGTEVGVLAIGAYTEAPSAIGTDNAQLLRSDKEGALYVRLGSGITAFDATSADIQVSGSALLHGIHISYSDVNAGDSITIGDGVSARFNFLLTSTSGNESRDFTAGVVFENDIRHVSSLGPPGVATSVTLVYSQF